MPPERRKTDPLSLSFLPLLHPQEDHLNSKMLQVHSLLLPHGKCVLAYRVNY